MTLEERANLGSQLKASGACNCTCAVLMAFQDKLPLSEEDLRKISAGFAAGMGSMEGTCGALIGAVMVAGFLTEGKGTPRYSREIMKKFQESSKATICKDLKGVGRGCVLCECPDCVKNAILALGQTIPIEYE